MLVVLGGEVWMCEDNIQTVDPQGTVPAAQAGLGWALQRCGIGRWLRWDLRRGCRSGALTGGNGACAWKGGPTAVVWGEGLHTELGSATTTSSSSTNSKPNSPSFLWK